MRPTGLFARGIGASLALVATLGCQPPPTVILVALDTDAPPDRMLTVRATVRLGVATDGDGGVHAFTRGPLGTDRLPGTFAIIPGTAAHDAIVTVVFDAELAASSSGDPAVSFRRVETWRFAPDTTQRESVFLALGCAAVATGCSSTSVACTVAERCEEQGQTCGDDATCAPVEAPPDAGVDGSTPDAMGASDASDATDASDGSDATDAGVADGSLVPVAGVCTHASCAAGLGCFAFGAISYCEYCGQPGQRACVDTTPCVTGQAVPFSDGSAMCVERSAVGGPGGSCTRAADCGPSGFQCTMFAGTQPSACLACGAAGEPCCCPGGTSCACMGSSYCTHPTGATWTICR